MAIMVLDFNVKRKGETSSMQSCIFNGPREMAIRKDRKEVSQCVISVCERCSCVSKHTYVAWSSEFLSKQSHIFN